MQGRMDVNSAMQQWAALHSGIINFSFDTI
jgi:hypothetical protein